jgi:hypothetical protein
MCTARAGGGELGGDTFVALHNRREQGARATEQKRKRRALIEAKSGGAGATQRLGAAARFLRSRVHRARAADQHDARAKI